MNMVFLAGVLLFAISCHGLHAPTASARVVNEIESARMQMGRIDDDTPHWQIIAYPELSFGHVIDVGMMLYTDTRLTDRRDATLRRLGSTILRVESKNDSDSTIPHPRFSKSDNMEIHEMLCWLNFGTSIYETMGLN